MTSNKLKSTEQNARITLFSLDYAENEWEETEPIFAELEEVWAHIRPLFSNSSLDKKDKIPCIVSLFGYEKAVFERKVKAVSYNNQMYKKIRILEEGPLHFLMS